MNDATSRTLLLVNVPKTKPALCSTDMIGLSVFWYESLTCRKFDDAFVYIVITHVTKITRSVNWPKSLYAMHRGILNSVTKTRMSEGICMLIHVITGFSEIQDTAP